MARKNPGDAEVIVGHVLDVLAGLPAESVSCVVTSPPYWSLRKYDAPDVVWGGDTACLHEWGDIVMGGESYNSAVRWEHGDPEKAKSRADFSEAWQKQTPQGQFCSRCGAWRGQYGLEPTPELYVEHTLEVLRAIRLVLRPDGVVWWNIGDGYSSGGSGQQSSAALRGGTLHSTNSGSTAMPAYAGLPPKNLVLMPFRVALAAQADGWWVRSVIIWSKPNCMPESTKDRPTTAHEYVLMLTKSGRYWYDAEAVREKGSDDSHGGGDPDSDYFQRRDGHPGWHSATPSPAGLAGRNLRSVWEFPTAQTPEAHFATFPEELPRRCIEASCPREICAKCGTARVRVVERQTATPGQAPGYNEGAGRNDGDRAGSWTDAGAVTLGWTSCDCAEPDYRPGIVLDPFCGIGTTGVVAKRLGRRFIGIELSEKYAAMAREKLKFFWKKTNLSEPKLRPGQSKLPLG